MNKIAIINQGCVGMTKGEIKLATFGVSGCIALALCYNNVKFLCRISTPAEAKNCIEYIGQYKFKVNDSKKITAYLIGGHKNVSEETRDILINHLKYFQIENISDKTCESDDEIKSVLVNNDNTIEPYYVTGNEKFEVFDVFAALTSGMTGVINCVCNWYTCSAQIIDATHKSFFDVKPYHSHMSLELYQKYAMTGNQLPRTNNIQINKATKKSRLLRSKTINRSNKLIKQKHQRFFRY